MAHNGITTTGLVRAVLEAADSDSSGRVKMTMAELEARTRRGNRSIQKSLKKLYVNGVLDTEYDPETGERIFVILRRTQEQLAV